MSGSPKEELPFPSEPDDELEELDADSELGDETLASPAELDEERLDTDDAKPEVEKRVSQAWQPNMGDLSLFGEAGLQDMEAALMIQKSYRGRAARKQAKKEAKQIEQMRLMRDQARQRQSAVDESIRDKVIQDMRKKAQIAGRDFEQLDERKIQKKVDAAVRIQRNLRMKKARKEANKEIRKSNKKLEKSKTAPAATGAKLGEEADMEVWEMELKWLTGNTEACAEDNDDSAREDTQRCMSPEEEEEKQEQAASMIQRIYRGRMARAVADKEKDNRGAWLKEMAAALLIQKIIRGKTARRQVADEKRLKVESATKMQAALRGFKGRREAQQMREDRKKQAKAAEKIQRRQRRAMYSNSPSGTYPFFTSTRPADNSKAMLKIKEAEKDQSIDKLDFEFDCIGGQGAVWLAAVLRHSQKIVSLNLKGNYVCDRGCQLIATGLLKNKKLKHLDLSWNCIGDEGMMMLCLVLSKSSCLKRLNLAFNRIGNDGAEALAIALDTHPILKELDIQGNRFTYTGANWLITACKKNNISITLPVKDMIKTKGKSFEKMCENFFDSDIPMYLKEVYWPTFRARWGVLASQPLPRKPAEIQQMQEFRDVGAKIDTGLGELARQGVAMTESSTLKNDETRTLGRLPATPGAKSSTFSERSTTASSLPSKGGLGATSKTSLPEIRKKGTMQRSATEPQGLRRKA